MTIEEKLEQSIREEAHKEYIPVIPSYMEQNTAKIQEEAYFNGAYKYALKCVERQNIIDRMWFAFGNFCKEMKETRNIKKEK